MSEELGLMRRKTAMRTTRSISEERLKEIAAIAPTVDEEAPEITPEQAARARLAHESHPEWYRVTPVKQQICIKIDKDVLDALKEGLGERLSDKNQQDTQGSCSWSLNNER